MPAALQRPGHRLRGKDAWQGDFGRLQAARVRRGGEGQRRAVGPPRGHALSNAKLSHRRVAGPVLNSVLQPVHHDEKPGSPHP